jgi:Domain of unknown function (DUF4450)
MMKASSLVAASVWFFAAALPAWPQVPAALSLRPNLTGELDRPLRYHPDGTDFVIENGPEFFNRPLYGGNTAFRSDAGDRPEFTLYLPGRGGNFRFGLRTGSATKWLQKADRITARYRPGTMRYEIRDPLLGSAGVLELEVIALASTDGLILRAEAREIPPGVELLWAYGGVTGVRGTRDGDIGTERVPIGEYFQLKPEFCQDNVFTLGANTFTLRSKPATIAGVFPAGAALTVGDANQWETPAALFAARKSDVAAIAPTLPVVTGRLALTAGAPLYFALQRIAADGAATTGTDLDTYREVTADRPGAARAAPKLPLLPAFRADELPRVFAESQTHFQALRTRVAVETPDPFINAAVAALNVAADAVWDEPQRGIMHGAIAWRTRLLGWRGPYVLDALAWHDRARENFTYWTGRQNTGPIPEKIPPADAASNLARSEAALHSNGDMSNSHYDMNLVFIDALFRHLRWTGDLEFARTLWPAIERHLAWERRLFRREFGPDKLPLYEAYAAIWASDDLQYHGGGAAHASAYNYWHNTMAAQLARLLGHDATPYEREAALIARGMRELLWLPQQGTFGEFKDLLGNQLVHPSAALWTIYHTIDSEITTPAEARQMTRYVDAQIPHLPVRGPGVPADADYYVLASSNWMPYSWSINNVVMGENIHTALGFWQAGRADEAFRLTKGALLASMFMGISPGNVGSMNYLDVYRRESQRDFADGSGVLSRAMVEGLFGVRPDLLSGRLRLSPGFPRAWQHATLHHPKVDFEYRAEAESETFMLESHFGKPLELVLQIPARRRTARVTSNGEVVSAKEIDPSGIPRLEITVPLGATAKIEVVWSGAEIAAPDDGFSFAKMEKRNAVVAPSSGRLGSVEGLEPVDLTTQFNDRVTEIFRPGKYLSPRSPFVSLALPSQGIGAWAGHVNEMAEMDDRGLRAVAAQHGGQLVLPDGLIFATPSAAEAKNVLFASQWDNYPREAVVPLTGRASHVHLLMAGSTNFMQSRLDNGEIIVNYTDGSKARLALRNPETWWPIDQDYFTDDYQFRDDAPLPTRVDLKTGRVRVLDAATFKGKGRKVEGGAATVLGLPLDPAKTLQSLTVRALANDVVIGLMGVTLSR